MGQIVLLLVTLLVPIKFGIGLAVGVGEPSDHGLSLPDLLLVAIVLFLLVQCSRVPLLATFSYTTRAYHISH